MKFKCFRFLWRVWPLWSTRPCSSQSRSLCSAILWTSRLWTSLRWSLWWRRWSWSSPNATNGRFSIRQETTSIHRVSSSKNWHGIWTSQDATTWSDGRYLVNWFSLIFCETISQFAHFIYSGRFDRDVYEAVPADPYGSRRWVLIILNFCFVIISVARRKTPRAFCSESQSERQFHLKSMKCYYSKHWTKPGDWLCAEWATQSSVFTCVDLQSKKSAHVF